MAINYSLGSKKGWITRRLNKNDIPWNKGIPMSEEAKRKLSKSLKGKTSWAKGKTFSIKYRKKLSESHKGKNESLASNWKGNKAGYHAIHLWINKYKIKPQQCTDCGKEVSKYSMHWSNIDHKYRRNLDDYIARCSSCHKCYDLKNGLSKH